MITTLIATALMFAPGQAASTACPIMGSPTNDKSQALDYNGIRFRMCCAGCDGTFKTNAATIVGKLKADSKAIGEFMFDPMTGKPISSKDSKGTSDYMGIRYFFASADDKAKFDKSPKSFASMPKKEILGCVVNTADQLKSYADAGGYVDYNGTRMYVCCASCLTKLKADPAKYAKASESKAKAPVVQAVK